MRLKTTHFIETNYEHNATELNVIVNFLFIIFI